MQDAADIDGIIQALWDSSSDFGVEPPLTDAVLEEAEGTLGLRLPALLVRLLGLQNGGSVREERNAFPTDQPTIWADDHVPFELVNGLGMLVELAAEAEEWEIPDGVVLLAGSHEAGWVALDYRDADPGSEPAVSWLEDGETIDLAASFEEFLRGLRPMTDFDDDEPADLDEPPGDDVARNAMSFEIYGLRNDAQLLLDGRRSLENTKAWCARRVAAALEFLPAAQTGELAARLEVAHAADDEAALADAIGGLVVALDALVPAWIEAEGFGHATDRMYLDGTGPFENPDPKLRRP